MISVLAFGAAVVACACDAPPAGLMCRVQEMMKQKRLEREEKEKQEQLQREKQRRSHGKELTQVKQK